MSDITQAPKVSSHSKVISAERMYSVPNWYIGIAGAAKPGEGGGRITAKISWTTTILPRFAPRFTLPNRLKHLRAALTVECPARDGRVIRRN